MFAMQFNLSLGGPSGPEPSVKFSASPKPDRTNHNNSMHETKVTVGGEINKNGLTPIGEITGSRYTNHGQTSATLGFSGQKLGGKVQSLSYSGGGAFSQAEVDLGKPSRDSMLTFGAIPPRQLDIKAPFKDQCKPDLRSNYSKQVEVKPIISHKNNRP